jgi:hypothetical protein
MIEKALGNVQSDLVLCQKYGDMMIGAAQQRADKINSYVTGQSILDLAGLAACSDAYPPAGAAAQS